MISMRSAFFTFRSESLEEYICMAYGPAVKEGEGEALRGVRNRVCTSEFIRRSVRSDIGPSH